MLRALFAPRELQRRARRRSRAVFRTAFICLSLIACGGAGSRGKPPNTAAGEIGPVTSTAVDDAAFAPSTYRILVGADSGQTRASLLAGVVARQLERARQRFES